MSFLRFLSGAFKKDRKLDAQFQELSKNVSDPLEIADLRLAFGRYSEATDRLNEAIESDPKNVELRQKAIEVLFVWGDKNKFLSAVQKHGPFLQGTEHWPNVLKMTESLCPGESRFGRDG